MSRSNCPPRSLRIQFLWMLLANGLVAVAHCMVLVVLNKWGSPSVAGRYTLALAITGPWFMMANLRLGTMLATDQNSHFPFRSYFRLRRFANGTMLGVFVLLLILIWGTKRGALFGEAYRRDAMFLVILGLVGLAKTIESTSELFNGWQQRLGRLDQMAGSLVLHAAASSVLFSLAFMATGHLVVAAVGLVIARLAIFALYDSPLSRDAWSKNHAVEGPLSPTERTAWTELTKRTEWQLLLQAWPLGMTSLFLALTSSFPRYLLSTFHSDHVLGIFGSAAAILQVGTLIFRAIEQPVSPRFAFLLREKKYGAFWSLLLLLVGGIAVVGSVTAVLAWWIGPDILSFLLTPDYAELGGLMAWMVLATIVGQVTGLVESALIAARITHVQVLLHGITAISCLVACWCWTESYGMYGAIWGLTICRIPFLAIGLLLLIEHTGQLTLPHLWRPLPETNRATYGSE